MQIHSPSAAVRHFPSELDRLGDEIAELSAHLDAATARRLSMCQRATSIACCTATMAFLAPRRPLSRW